MIITLCASLSFFETSQKIKQQLEGAGFTVLWPWGMELMERDELTIQNLPRFKEQSQYTAIKKHYEKIKKADAVLIINEEKNGIKNYIGGNTLMEMGFAFVLDKPIYLLNPIPDMSYREEIVAMKPVVIKGDIQRITYLLDTSSKPSP